MVLQELSAGQIEGVLTRHFQTNAPRHPEEARIILQKYHQGATDILPEYSPELIRVYWALQLLTCFGMGTSHAADRKRADRRFGQDLRKNRTGSRRG